MIDNREPKIPLVIVGTLLLSMAAPAFAQGDAPRAWIDIDDAFARPTEDPQTYALSTPLFLETATASVSYPEPARGRVPAFGGGVRIYRRFGAGLRVGAEDKQTLDSTITVSVPNPVFFNRPRTAQITMPLERTERTIDLAVEYLVPLPGRIGVRAFAGRSRVRITQALIQEVRYAESSGGTGVTIENVTQQTADGFAWGALVGIDAGVFVLRNVGVGVQIAHRTADIPSQLEPFTSQPLALSPRRTDLAVGLRLRF